jgi:hypothetical protein
MLVYIHISVYMCVLCIYIYMHIYGTYIYIYTYAYVMHIHTYIHTYIQSDDVPYEHFWYIGLKFQTDRLKNDRKTPNLSAPVREFKNKLLSWHKRKWDIFTYCVRCIYAWIYTYRGFIHTKMRHIFVACNTYLRMDTHI